MTDLRVGMRNLTLTVLAPLIVFTLLSGYQLELPGLHNDEAQEGGLPAMQLVGSGPVTAFRDVGLGPRQYPLMVQDYIGAINVYLLAPLVGVLGPSVASVRITSILVSIATLITTFGFATAVWGKRAAFFAVGLLAINPSFVFWSRQGILIASLTLTMTVALMWVGFHWSIRGGRRWALLAGFVAGLGIYSKLLFLWVILGMVGTIAILNLPLLWHPGVSVWPRRPTVQEGSAALIGLIVGVMPMLAYNFVSGGTIMAGRVAVLGSEKILLENIAGRLDHLRAVITGREHFWYLGGSAANMLWEWAFAVSVLVTLARASLGRPGSRRTLALLLTLFLGLLQVPFTPTASGMFPHHLALFSPLWVMLVAVTFSSGLSLDWRGIWRNLDRNAVTTVDVMTNRRQQYLHFDSANSFIVGIGKASLIIGLLALAVRDVQVNLFYHSVLRRSGGEGQYSDAIYHLVDALESRPRSTVVALDWGFAPQVRYLTEERIIPHEIFGYTREVDQGFAPRVEQLLAVPDAVFVAHFPNETFFPRRKAFENVAAANGFGVEVQEIVAGRTGAPIFELLVVTRN